jgi:polyisoprenoid-binding protein YceI
VTRYRIVPDRSRMWIDGRSSVHPIHSSTDGLEGYVELEIGPDGRVDVAAKPSGKLTLSATRLSSGNRLEDRELHKRIDIRRYPNIEGVLDEMSPSGDGAYQVSGEVTFRGVARRHQDEMTVDAVDEQTVRLEGKSRFDVRDFGMEPPRMLMLKVAPEVEIRVEIVAVREG